MKDVAALAGVAIKTVSRVMNGDQTVAPDLAARVRDAASKLGYRPNLTASSLRRVAAQLLFARLDGDDSPARTHVVPTGLVMRGSGEIRPSATAMAAGR